MVYCQSCPLCCRQDRHVGQRERRLVRRLQQRSDGVVWLGYDNADGKRRTLGGGATGGGVAVPIFEPVIEAAWAHVVPKTALAPPSSEADLSGIVAIPI